MEHTRQRILDETRKLIENMGPESVSMRRVAQLVGISPMAIYRHFANRADLLQRVADSAYVDLANHWSTIPRSSDPQARVAALVDDHIDLALGQPQLYDFLFLSPRVAARQWPDDFGAADAPTVNVVVAALGDSVDRADVRDVSLMIAALLHGLIHLQRAGRLGGVEEDFRALCHRLVDRLLADVHV